MTKVVEAEVKTTKRPLPSPSEVPFLKLSDLTKLHLLTPQRSDTFVKRFKEAIRAGEIAGAVLKGDKFTLPKKFRRRDSEGEYTRDIRDYVVRNDNDFHEWFTATNTTLGSTREGKVRVTLDAITSGTIDFESLVEDTRRNLQKSYEKGHNLGVSRAKGTKKSTEEEPEVKTVAKGKKAAPAPAKPAAKPTVKAKAKPAPEPEPEEEEDDEDAFTDDLADDEEENDEADDAGDDDLLEDDE